MVQRSVRVGELKGHSLERARERLEAARAEGVEYLDVLNRSRPIFHLGYPDDLPAEWREQELQQIPHVDIRKGRASLYQLRKRGAPLLLTQNVGEPLALWPVQEGYTIPLEEVLPHQLLMLVNDGKKLRRRVRKLEVTLTRMRDLLLRQFPLETVEEPDEDVDEKAV
jgi:hypothetical protein